LDRLADWIMGMTPSTSGAAAAFQWLQNQPRDPDKRTRGFQKQVRFPFLQQLARQSEDTDVVRAARFWLTPPR
jgi:hypothetical protein